MPKPVEKMTAEFTSGQLVIGICVSLFLALFFFLLGYTVRGIDSPLGASAPKAETQAAATKPASGEGVQRSPRTDAARPPAAPAFTRMDERNGPRKVELPLEPAARSGPESASPSPAPTSSPPSPAASPAQSPAAAPAPVPPAEAPTGMTRQRVPLDPSAAPAAGPASTPVQTAAASAPAPSAATPAAVPASAPAPPSAPAVPAAPKPSTPTASGAKGAFAIQLAAFTGADRQRRASEFKDRLLKNAKLNAEIFPDEKYHRVLIVGYENRAAADAALAELKKKAGFAEAFVRAVP